MSSILVTGFEPFGGDSENPSEQIARAIDGWRLGEARVAARVFKVEHRGVAPVLRAWLGELRPSLVVCLGLANGRPGISLERLALNLADFTQPDNAGVVARNEKIADDGPFVYAATLPLDPCLAQLTDLGIPAEISNSAGAYLCNEVMYLALHYAALHGSTYRAGFVHLPYASEYIAKRGRLAPSLPLPMLIEAIKIIIQESLS